MANDHYLVDTSVLGRANQDLVGEKLTELARQGRMWTCQVIDLEVLYASRAREAAAVASERSALPSAPIDGSVIDRAIEVAIQLAESGHHRGAKPMDLVIAASAEAASLTVLHYDADYDRIRSVTRQPTEWIATAGTLDA